MSGFNMAFEWDDAEFQQMIGGMVRSVQEAAPVMESFAEYMMTETIEHFEKEEAPDGQGWQALSDVTISQREKANKWPGKKLQVDGNLKTSIQRSWDDSSAELTAGGSNLEYAAIHNFGGQAGRGRKVTIPQRQFMGLNDDDIAYFKKSLAGWILTGRV